MFKVNHDPETGKIKSLQVSDVLFSYSYLVTPRPESDFNAGTYGTELIIRDSETVSSIKKYLQQVIEEARVTTWEGKVPKTLNLPLKAGNEDSDLESGAFVLKTSSKTQPKLFIRLDHETRAHEVTEEELDEIYAGMVGEAIVTFRAYAYNGIKGIKAYLNAVCKTANGKPLSGKVSYEDAFSSTSEFDAPEVIVKTTKKTVATNLEDSDSELNLDALLSPQGASNGNAPATKSNVIQKNQATANLTIDDLLNG
jgi:hypothetical protein